MMPFTPAPIEDWSDPEHGDIDALLNSDWTGKPPTPRPVDAVPMPEVGSSVWFSRSGIMYARVNEYGRLVSEVSAKGDVLVVDEQTIDMTADRFGRPGWLGLVLDTERQIERWGEVVIHVGTPPSKLDRLDRDSPAALDEERARRLAAARLIADPGERLAAGRAIREDLGAGGASQTLRGN